MPDNLKIGRNEFVLIIAILTGISSYLTDLIPVIEIRGFVVFVIAALIAYFLTENEEKNPVDKTQTTTQGQTA